MTDEQILAAVKKGLGITGTYHDDTLNFYIADVKAFMANAGVDADVITDEKSVGCIMRGVADLWNNGNGNTTFSEYFRMRLLQLKQVEIEEGDS